jgi:pimeloyl-ACP methyl ester carboxylesterase
MIKLLRSRRGKNETAPGTILVSILALALAASAGAEPSAQAEQAEEKAVSNDEIVFTSGLAAGPVGRYGRSAVHSDPIEHRLLTGGLGRLEEGAAAVTEAEGGEILWKAIEAGEDGWFKGRPLRGGYLYVPVDSLYERTMILEASGQSWVFVNGEPRGGDVYAYGWIQHPVRLKKGRNHFLFRVSRGRVRAKLVKPTAAVTLSDRDMTLPDVLAGEDEPLWAAVRVLNATGVALTDFFLRVQADGAAQTEIDLPAVGPLTSRKVGFPITCEEVEEGGEVAVTVVLTRRPDTGDPYDSLELKLKVRSPQDRHKRTFVSNIDGSVQYYCVTPGEIPEGEKPALFLTLHGAAVKAENQAAAYGPKSWGHVVAPTNRRPYGFDWEDWGRLDALEVLALAEERFGTDPARTYLTGHSMGGHGTWSVGATHPGRFAAIGPSAGWYSFWSYAGKERDGDASPIEELFARASSPSDTLALSRNFLHHGVYVLHGDRDDNVPVGQARFMRKHLAEFHADFAYYERPGAGHWWGNACCDWPPMFDFFEAHAIPDNRDVPNVEFKTANPGIASRSRWLAIEAQQEFLKVSSASITQDVKKRTFTGTTENVALLSLELGQLDPGETVTVELDGQKIENIATPEGRERLFLARVKDEWMAAFKPALDQKGPHRCGTFKDAFRHRVLFIYGTAGSAEENAWAYAKARYDAETFWYRANGSIDVIPDTLFDPAAEPDRNVIVYGNAETNSAWLKLLRSSPVQVTRGRIAVGERLLEGDDLGCYFVRPRPGSRIASVGAVAGTGLPGMKAASANQYFISGSGFPDVLVFGKDMLLDHFAGVRCVGYFGIDWSVEKGEFAWRD